MVVVVSAQGHTTDELIRKAEEINPRGSPREMDAYLAAGEQLSAGLMAMALGPVTGGTVRSITLFSVMIYELVAPLLSKVALQLAGEIHPKSTKVGLSEDH